MAALTQRNRALNNNAENDGKSENIKDVNMMKSSSLDNGKLREIREIETEFWIEWYLYYIYTKFTLYTLYYNIIW